MGQMIKVPYLGAFLEVNHEDFQTIKCEDEFYEQVADEHFINPYQGLEDLNILIPSSKDYSIEIDLDGEFIVTATDLLNAEVTEDMFKQGYAEQIAIVERFFPGCVIIKSGLVCYWDEIA